LNHRKKLNAEPSRLIPQKPGENLELLFVRIGSLQKFNIQKHFREKEFLQNVVHFYNKACLMIYL